MNEYIFWTQQGWTLAPCENYEVENCQVLGWQTGATLEIARSALLQENPWILEAGFEEMRAAQTITHQQKSDLRRVTEYLWEGEKRAWEALGKPDGHIFCALQRLQEMARE